MNRQNQTVHALHENAFYPSAAFSSALRQFFIDNTMKYELIDLKTARLQLRRLQLSDAERLRPILQNIEVMYAWEHAFTHQEISAWLLENLHRYQNDGYSYMAAENPYGTLVGVIGLLTEHVDGRSQLGIGWIFEKRFWGQGYAREGAQALLQYAFQTLKATQVIATIRPENIPSRKLAERLGMQLRGSFLKEYRGKTMKHLIYQITNP